MKESQQSKSKSRSEALYGDDWVTGSGRCTIR